MEIDTYPLKTASYPQVEFTPFDLMQIAQISDEDVKEIIDETDSLCQLSEQILNMHVPWHKYQKFAVVDIQNQLHDYRYSHCGKRRGCGRQCYNLRSVIEDISYEHPDKLLFVVQKESNFCGTPSDDWWKLMLKLSKIKNVIMCVALSPRLMDISPDISEKYDAHIQLKFQREKKDRKKEVEHDDITVLMLKKIIDAESLQDTLLISSDQYRDEEEVIHTTVPFEVHFLYGGEELLEVQINPKTVNGITPCTCHYDDCQY